MRNLVIFILLFVFGIVFIAAIFEAVVHFNKTGDTPTEFHQFETNGSATFYSSTITNNDGEVASTTEFHEFEANGSATVYSSTIPNYDREVASREHGGTGLQFTTNTSKEATLEVPPRKQQRNFNVKYATSSVQQTTKRTTTIIPRRTTPISVPIKSAGTFLRSSQNELVFKNSRDQSLASSCTQSNMTNDEGTIRSPDQYPQEESCFTWYIDVGEGYSIDITVSVLDLDGSSGDYLILSPSQEEVAETSNPVFTWYLKTEKQFRIIDRGTAFILFKTFSKTSASQHQGFEISYARYGNATTPADETTQPALPTPPANVDQSAVVYISLAGGVNMIEEFYNRSTEFRTAVSEIASAYCNETGIDLTAEPSYANVILDSVNPCQLTWPDSSSCLRIRMTVPVNNTNTSIYELTSGHISEMWNKHATNYLASFATGMKVYQPPDGSNFMIWIVVSTGTVVVFSIVLALIWKIDIFKEDDSENKIVLDEDLRRPTIDNVLISVPPSFPADTFDPESHKIVSWNGDKQKDSIASVGMRESTIPKYGPPKGYGAAVLFQWNIDEEDDEVHYEKIGDDNPKIQLSNEPKLSTVL